jgi:hypothetical protein
MLCKPLTSYKPPQLLRIKPCSSNHGAHKGTKQAHTLFSSLSNSDSPIWYDGFKLRKFRASMATMVVYQMGTRRESFICIQNCRVCVSALVNGQKEVAGSNKWVQKSGCSLLHGFSVAFDSCRVYTSRHDPHRGQTSAPRLP